MGENRYLLSLVFMLAIWNIVPAAEPACETMTSCDLFSSIQEHSKLIAGFSYNVKKADNALTQLRSEKISLTNRVLSLEEELKEGENDTVLLTNQEVLNKLTLQDNELETGIENLSSKLENLREEVNVIFQDNIRSNDNDLIDLQTKLNKLTKQVEKLKDIVKNHTEDYGLMNPSENPEISNKDNRQVSAFKMKYSRLENQVNEIIKSCGNIGEKDSLDSLGIELETIKSSYDALQDQVTELEQKCKNQNGEMEAMLEQLIMKVEELEEKNVKNRKEAQDRTILSNIHPDDANVAVIDLSSPP